MAALQGGTGNYDAIRKRIIICCDGTWQSSVSGEKNIPSNVTRMCRHLAREAVTVEDGKRILWKQVVFYDAGIGTGDLSFLDTARQGGTGAGLAHNVFECYNFIANNYTPGDKIYCFGFSRGAYTARSLSGFITNLGVCDPLDMMSFPVVYDKYEAALPKRDGESHEARRNREDFYGVRDMNGTLQTPGLVQKWLAGDPIDIELGDHGARGTVVFNSGKRTPISKESMKVEVVGVWDTVGALGVPKIFGWLSIPFLHLNKPGREFHDVSLNANVKHAFHAIALDERRLPFSPTLWYVPRGQSRPTGSSFKQVWFPGCHINVGGGSDDVLDQKQSDFEQLANITFMWMIQQCRPYLAFDMDGLKTVIAGQKVLLARLHGDTLPLPKGFSKPFAWLWRAINKAFGRKEPTIDARGGWGVGPVVDSFSSAGLSIKLGGWKVRTPGQVKQPESISNQSLSETVEMGSTNEEIHPCVWYRFQASEIPKSKALKNWHRVARVDPKDGWEWRKDGVSLVLPESKLTANPSDDPNDENYERLLARENGAADYLDRLDRMYATGNDQTFESVSIKSKLTVSTRERL